MRHSIGIAILGVVVSTAAEGQDLEGPYVGASLGSFNYEEDGDIGVTISDTTTAYRAFAGWQFNEYYAVEAGYAVTDDIEEGFYAYNPDVGDLTLTLEGEYEISTVRVLAFAPFSSVNMFGGVGYFDAQQKSSFRYTSPVEVITGSGEDEDDGLTVIGGIQFEMRRFSVRGEYEWFDTESGVNAAALNVAVLLRF